MPRKVQDNLRAKSGITLTVNRLKDKITRTWLNVERSSSPVSGTRRVDATCIAKSLDRQVDTSSLAESIRTPRSITSLVPSEKNCIRPVDSQQPRPVAQGCDGTPTDGASTDQYVPRREHHMASEAAKLCIRALRDSADAFPPLKSLLGGISFFIDNHEKWEANKDNLERLAARMSRLVAGQLVTNQACNPAEIQRREELERKLSQIANGLEDLKNGNQVLKYLMASSESGIISRIVEDVNTAITDYQFSSQEETYGQVLKLIESADMALLKELPRAKDAGIQSREPSTGCFPGTRIDVLNKLECWVNNRNPDAQRVYWLNGHAGSGKSTIAQTFCHRLYANGQLGASFFCSRDFVERSDIKMIFPTLAFQLACRYPKFRLQLVGTLKNRPDLGSESIITQLTELIVKPLQESGISTIISIDALDECKDHEPASTILCLLAQVVDRIPLVKFFVTGRPEAPLIEGFRVAELRPHTEIMLMHEVEQSDVDRDIALYVRSQLHNLTKRRRDLCNSQVWPPDDQLSILISKSSKYFIFASTCVKIISTRPPSDPREILRELTESSSTSLAGKGGIDQLYSYILAKAFSLCSTNIQAELRLILGAVILCFNPLSSKALSALLNTPSLETRLDGFNSLLLIPESDSECVRTYHKSFSDYLTDRERCADHPFYIDPQIFHSELAIACLEYMKKNLTKNTCSLPRYAMNSVMPLELRRARIGEPLEYACLFWAQHVCQAVCTGERMDKLLAALFEFQQKRQKLWLEVLNLIEKLHQAVLSLRLVQDWLKKVSKRENSDGIRDAHIDDLRFERSIIRRSQNGGTKQALRLNASIVDGSDLAFSKDSSMIAVTTSKGIEIFQVTTGHRQCILESNLHLGGGYTCPEFLQNDSLLLSACIDSACLWDVHTGCLIQHYRPPLPELTPTERYHGFLSGSPDYQIVDLDISPDQCYIACAYEEGHIYVLNRLNGTLIQSFKVPSNDMIQSISFSSSGDSIFICTTDGIQCWRYLAQVTEDFEQKGKFKDFFLSEDRLLLAGISNSNITLYDTNLRQIIWELELVHQDVQGVIAISSTLHAIWILRRSSLEVVDFSNPDRKFLGSECIGQDMVSFGVVSPDYSNVAYRYYNDAISIHPFPIFDIWIAYVDEG